MIEGRENTHYAMGFGDAPRLDVEAIVDEVLALYTRYTLRLHPASGADQTIVVSAPVGGLELEMRDMTGDGIPNDLVVTPALLHLPLMVLVNDGNDHFTVAISASDPLRFGGRQVSAA